MRSYRQVVSQPSDWQLPPMEGWMGRHVAQPLHPRSVGARPVALAGTREVPKAVTPGASKQTEVQAVGTKSTLANPKASGDKGLQECSDPKLLLQAGSAVLSNEVQPASVEACDSDPVAARTGSLEAEAGTKAAQEPLEVVRPSGCATPGELVVEDNQRLPASLDLSHCSLGPTSESCSREEYFQVSLSEAMGTHGAVTSPLEDGPLCDSADSQPAQTAHQAQTHPSPEDGLAMPVPDAAELANIRGFCASILKTLAPPLLREVESSLLRPEAEPFTPRRITRRSAAAPTPTPATLKRNRKASAADTVLLNALGIASGELVVNEDHLRGFRALFDSPIREQQLRVLAGVFGKTMPPIAAPERAIREMAVEVRVQ